MTSGNGALVMSLNGASKDELMDLVGLTRSDAQEIVRIRGMDGTALKMVDLLEKTSITMDLFQELVRNSMMICQVLMITPVGRRRA